MKILVLNNEYPPLGGGTATVCARLLREFIHFPDFSFHLVTSSGVSTGRTEQIASNVIEHYLPVPARSIHHATNAELLRFAWQAFCYSRALHRKEQFSLCLAFSTVPAGAVASTLALIYRIPFIVRVCGPDIPGFEERYNYLYPLLRPVLRRTWRSARMVIAKSSSELQLLRQACPNVESLIIPNGADPTFVERKNDRTQEPLAALCVGRLIERKGHRFLLQALRILRAEGIQIRLTLVGEGDSDRELQAMVRDFGLVEQVEFRGAIDRAAMPAVYQGADVFLLASENDSMSVALLEAMASGLPIIATPTGGVEQLLAHSRAGFVIPHGDPLALARELRWCVEHRDLLPGMGQEARVAATANSWRSIAQKYAELFQTVRSMSPRTEGSRRTSP